MATTRFQIHRILCPTDFSEFSARALAHAVALGRSFDARVTALHVMPYLMPSATGALPDFPIPMVTTEALRAEAAGELSKFVEPARGERVPIDLRLLEGDPSRVIASEAADLAADLIVMGTHGRSGFEHLLLGSVTEKVLRRAPCPVLTVSHEGELAHAPVLFRRILCAADLGASGSPTIELAVSLAEENQADLTLLHVLEGLPEGSAHLYLAVPGIGPLRQDLEREALQQLRAKVPAAARDWCEVKERVTAGQAGREILRIADEEQADLIVLGTHGHGALGTLVFGSTCNQVVRAAKCPVLTVRRVKAREERATEAVALPREKGEGR